METACGHRLACILGTRVDLKSMRRASHAHQDRRIGAVIYERAAKTRPRVA
jgi:hypothetical protein